MHPLANAAGSVLLACTSGWAIKEVRSLPFACGAFGLTLCTGITGAVHYALDMSNLNDICCELTFCSYVACAPLLACEIAKAGGLEQNFCYLHLILPAYLLISRYAMNNNGDHQIMDLNMAVSLLSICYFTFVKEHMYGYFGAAFYFVTWYKIGRYGMLSGDKEHFQGSLMLSACNFLMLKALQGF